MAELSLSLQAKLLRVLQEKSFARLGSSHEITSDFRLLAASHKDLAAEVAAGRFREDLFFRLAVYELEVSPLREHREDIPLLVQHLLREARKRENKPCQISAEAMQALQKHNFPGNVRELQNSIQRALVTATEAFIQLEDLPKRILAGEKRAAAPLEVVITNAEPAGDSPALLPAISLDKLEKLAIEAAINRNQGNMSTLATQLGIGRTTLYRKIKEYRINL